MVKVTDVPVPLLVPVPMISASYPFESKITEVIAVLVRLIPFVVST
jgi:hypothetical protein